MSDEIYKKLAEKYSIPVEVIEKICRSQFDYLSTIFSEGNFKSLRLPKLGIFKVKRRRVDMLREKWGFNFTEEQIQNSYEK